MENRFEINEKGQKNHGLHAGHVQILIEAQVVLGPVCGSMKLLVEARHPKPGRQNCCSQKRSNMKKSMASHMKKKKKKT